MITVLEKGELKTEENWFHIESDSQSVTIVLDRLVPFSDASSKQFMEALKSIPNWKKVSVDWNPPGVKMSPEQYPQYWAFCWGMQFGHFVAHAETDPHLVKKTRAVADEYRTGPVTIYFPIYTARGK